MDRARAQIRAHHLPRVSPEPYPSVSECPVCAAKWFLDVQDGRWEGRVSSSSAPTMLSSRPPVGLLAVAQPADHVSRRST